MNQEIVIDIASQALIVAMKVAAPSLLAIMFTGLIVSIFQAATQINEQTLSFIPKILAMTGALMVAGPWILQVFVFFTTDLIKGIPNITR